QSLPPPIIAVGRQRFPCLIIRQRDLISSSSLSGGPPASSDTLHLRPRGRVPSPVYKYRRRGAKQDHPPQHHHRIPLASPFSLERSSQKQQRHGRHHAQDRGEAPHGRRQRRAQEGGGAQEEGRGAQEGRRAQGGHDGEDQGQDQRRRPRRRQEGRRPQGEEGQEEEEGQEARRGPQGRRRPRQQQQRQRQRLSQLRPALRQRAGEIDDEHLGEV
uniref:Uncharacterized protein n=1 Tax=Triticum urartu TaxID=4572 RepID=A0A8R7U2Y5_TRIUA